MIKMKDFIDIRNFSKKELEKLLKDTKKLSNSRKNYLKGKLLALVFEKPSTRTSLSFMVAMNQLGGNSLYFKGSDLQLSRGEPIKDLARVFTKQVDGIAARVYSHSSLLELSAYSSIPIINALSDLLHPCQALADMYTIKNHFGKLKELTLAYVGDGNNVCNSLINAGSKFGLKINIACPKGYEPDKNVLQDAEKISSDIKIFRNPEDAVKDAQIIYTDVWVSMGEESEKEKRLRVFKKYQVNSKLISKINGEYIIMHCLPAHRGLEITDKVIESTNSVVWEQAYNRLLTAKSLLYNFL